MDHLLSWAVQSWFCQCFMPLFTQFALIECLILCQNGQCYFWNWKLTIKRLCATAARYLAAFSYAVLIMRLLLFHYDKGLYISQWFLWFYCSENVDDSCQILFRMSKNVLNFYYKKLTTVLHFQCERVNNICKYVYYCICILKYAVLYIKKCFIYFFESRSLVDNWLSLLCTKSAVHL